jgi:uncharacterized protein YigA (DUF484 family)
MSSTKTAHDLNPAELDEQAVTHYLQQHPDLFERHPQLLTRLRLTHPRHGTTISLIERQVEVLRDKHTALEQQLSDFVRVARANDQLADKIHGFTRKLLRSSNRPEVLALVETSLRDDFDAYHAVLVLPGAGNEDMISRFLKPVAHDDPAWRSFDGLFASGKPRCGQVRDSQREFLFGADASGIGSVALMPLLGTKPQSLLALGSPDRDRFHPGMSTEFLSRMAELITDALSRG